MSEEVTGNVLVVQSGGPTTAINSSLAGVITEALNHDQIEEIYGCLGGIEGILSESFIDLASESQQTIRALQYTPGAALGRSRFMLKSAEDAQRIVQVLQAHEIRYFFNIGGNDSQESTALIAQAAAEQGYDLRAIGIPKTVDNDIATTDHCPGFGSTAKYLATTIREMALDHESVANHDLVSIVEVMGRNTGWVAASTTFAKSKPQAEDAPHLIYLPERPFSAEKLYEDVRNVLKKNKFCMIVASEGLVDTNGNYLANTSTFTDNQGNPQLGGVGEHLHRLVEEHFEGIKVLSCKMGINQRAAGHCASKVDIDEAFHAGQTAVLAALKGETNKMVMLMPSEKDRHVCEMSTTGLSEIIGKTKTFPENWINEDGASISYAFHKYAFPLIQGEVEVLFENGLPKFAKLEKHRVERKLESVAQPA